MLRKGLSKLRRDEDLESRNYYLPAGTKVSYVRMTE